MNFHFGLWIGHDNHKEAYNRAVPYYGNGFTVGAAFVLVNKLVRVYI